ncbi:MAG: alpha/beta hydrolase [Myxococcales bacterium]|nr:alpha/beta hydrolase [Myxococcales bacterium]
MRNFGVLTRYLVLPVLFVITLGAISILATRALLQRNILQETAFKGPQGIDKVEAVKLGGWEQWLLMRGKNKRAPILLWLHDGPGGTSEMVFSRTFEQELAKQFVVVHWDQRGTGKSFRQTLPASSMTLPRMRADLEELVVWLCKRFKQDKIYLVGYAWGSTLGLWYAQKHPKRLHAYIGVSQILDWQQHLKDAYAKVLQQAKKTERKEPLDDLTRIGAPPYRSLASLQVLRRWVAEFGGYFHKAPAFGKMFRASLGSPDYTLGDLVRSNKAYQFSSSLLLLKAIEKIKLGSIQKLDVPVLFVSGRHDTFTSGAQLQHFFQRLQAPKKQMVWFEDSGYAPHREEATRFYKLLMDTLPKLRETPKATPRLPATSRPVSPASRPTPRVVLPTSSPAASRPISR